jgi:hypothetical protein
MMFYGGESGMKIKKERVLVRWLRSWDDFGAKIATGESVVISEHCIAVVTRCSLNTIAVRFHLYDSGCFLHVDPGMMFHHICCMMPGGDWRMMLQNTHLRLVLRGSGSLHRGGSMMI